MCVGLSARVVKVDKDVALIDAGGAKKSVSASLMEDLMPGDYVMVHAGTIISRIDGDDSAETSALLEELL